MTLYIAREASKLWRKVCMETTVEVQLLMEKWKLLLAGLLFQYIHGLAARGVHYLHRPGPVLQDLGFMALPELGQDRGYLIPRGVLYGCGDLIFSSHMIFTLVFVNTYQKYGSKRLIKFLAWVLVIIQSLFIIAARKHYSVDIVVAWYTVNLVVFFIDKKLPEMPDRTSGALLPLSVKEKDGRLKDEKPNKLLGGNTGDNNADWRQRTQMNGKHGEEGSLVNPDVTANGT